jgi:hypothetical protein
MASDAAADLAEVRRLIERTAEHARRLTADTGSPLDTLATALDVGHLAESALHAAVAAARAAGHTWQDISEVLGTSRQAAFQRFGKPIDPRTGVPMSRAPLPDGANRAVSLLAVWLAGGFDEAIDTARPLTEPLAERLTPALLGDALAEVIEQVGAYQGMGAPFARRRGENTVVDVPLEFEAGSMKGRVTFDTKGRVAGLFLLRPETL